jgi:hypothetical protein
MKFIAIILSFLLCNPIFAQSNKQIYEASNLSSEVKKHKLVAILPFQGQISYKKMPKGFDAEANKQEEKKLGRNLQEGMFTYLIRKQGSYTVEFQDVEKTLQLLRKAGKLDNLEEQGYDSLAIILGVDAVIGGSYIYEKTGSEAGAIAKAVIFGVGGSTASGSLTMKIYNGVDGTLLWRFFKEMTEGTFSSANELMERMMKKVARNFPYEK